MFDSLLFRPGSIMSEAIEYLIDIDDKIYTNAPMTPEEAVGTILSSAKDFPGYVRRIMIDFGENSLPFIKQYYIQALDSKDLQPYLSQMDSAEFVQNYDLDQKIRELYEQYGKPVINPVQILQPDEVIWQSEHLALGKKKRPPRTFHDTLQGIRNLWQRIVSLMIEDQWEVNGLELAVNIAIQEQGGWQKIKFSDNSYLRLLDPAILTESGWGTSPPQYIKNLKKCRKKYTVFMTPEDKASRDWKTVNQLSVLLFQPISV